MLKLSPHWVISKKRLCKKCSGSSEYHRHPIEIKQPQRMNGSKWPKRAIMYNPAISRKREGARRTWEKDLNGPMRDRNLVEKK